MISYHKNDKKLTGKVEVETVMDEPSLLFGDHDLNGVGVRGRFSCRSLYCVVDDVDAVLDLFSFESNVKVLLVLVTFTFFFLVILEEIKEIDLVGFRREIGTL